MLSGISLSKNSWHRNFYEFWWSKEAPDNLCNYFWALLLAVCTIFLIAGRAFYEIAKEKPWKTGVITKTIFYTINTAIVGGLGWVLGFIIGKAFFYPMIALASLGGLALGIGAIFLMVWSAIKVEESEVIDMTVTAVKAKKNKVCPKIDWK